jgi:hypothetical protein
MRQRLDEHQVAMSLGATIAEARKLMKLPDFPRPAIIDGKPMWDRAEVEHFWGTRWIRKRKRCFGGDF